MRIVVTIVGKDRVGIIARVSNVLAEHNINILNINQNIMDGFFNMVLIANTCRAKKFLPPCTAFRRARQCLKLRTFWKPRA